MSTPTDPRFDAPSAATPSEPLLPWDSAAESESPSQDHRHHHGHGGQRRRGHGRGHRRPWVKRHPVATGLITLLSILVLGVAGAALWLSQALGGINSIRDPFTALPTRAPAATSTAAGEPVTILMLGSDSRIDTNDPSQWKVGAQRTDAIMLLQISGDRRHVNVMSLPRDSWVTVPANQVVDHDSQAKVNAAYSWGGPSLLIQTIEQNTGIHVDHFAVANFQSFTQLTDALGGVTLTLSQPLTVTGPDGSKQTLEAGRQHLTGAQALAYARERYNLPGGDFDRMARQQNWMRAIMRQAASGETLSDPVMLAQLVRTASKSVATDEALGAGEMRELATSLRGIKTNAVTFFQAPVLGTGTSVDGQSIVNLDEERLALIAKGFQTDTLTEVVAENRDALRILGTQVN